MNESRVLELLCLREDEFKQNAEELSKQGKDPSELLTEVKKWKGKSIIDIARLGKMDKFIDHPIIQSDVNSTYYGVFSSVTGNGWSRMLAFLLSLLSFGVLAPVILKYKRQIVVHTGRFWEDMGPVKKEKQKEYQKESSGKSQIMSSNGSTRQGRKTK